MVNTVRLLLLFIASFAVLAGCGSRNNAPAVLVKSGSATDSPEEVAGNYVSDGYDERREGYDWVAVVVRPMPEGVLSISVRSRADKKSPTCTFDALAYPAGDRTYRSVTEGKAILFSFAGDSVAILPENEQDDNILYYFCSGGASLAGSYRKINGPLDERQIDKTIFFKALTLQNIFFDVHTVPSGVNERLTILVAGLASGNQKITLDVPAHVSSAETEDLDSDGFPELLIYAGHDIEKRVIVYGWTVKGGNSIHSIDSLSFSNGESASAEYGGFDEFSVVETKLVRRFPLFQNGVRAGRMRQIQYELRTAGERKKFEAIDSVEYDL